MTNGEEYLADLRQGALGSDLEPPRNFSEMTGTPESASNPEWNQLEYTDKLLAETRAEVRHADSKASLVLAAIGVGVGALVGGLIAGDWQPSDLANKVEWLWWLGAVAITYALYAAASAVWPRFSIPTDEPARIHYWGDIGAVESEERLHRILTREPPDKMDRAVKQLFILSLIVIRKYQMVRQAILVAGIGALLCGIAVFIDQDGL